MAARRKRYVMPAILSFFVAGLGQIVKGNGRRGVRIMIWFYMGMPVLILGAFLLHPLIFLVTLAGAVVLYPLIWLYNISDAYSSQAPERSRS